MKGIFNGSKATVDRDEQHAWLEQNSLKLNLHQASICTGKCLVEICTAAVMLI